MSLFFRFILLVLLSSSVLSATTFYRLGTTSASVNEADLGDPQNQITFEIDLLTGAGSTGVPTILGDGNLTVKWATIASTANPSDDYNSTSGTIIFDSSDTDSKELITVYVIGDNFIENNETFKIKLYDPVFSNSSYAMKDKTTLWFTDGTIINDDTLSGPYIQINNVSSSEGNLVSCPHSSTTDDNNLTFTISLQNLVGVNPVEKFTIDYKTSSSFIDVSQAIENVDYNKTIGSLEFNSTTCTNFGIVSNCELTINVPILPDCDIEPHERMQVELFNPSINVILDTYLGEGFIEDDDDQNATGWCSPHIGKTNLNEYNNIPAVKDIYGNGLISPGNFIELKRIDESFQPDLNWTITVYDKNNIQTARFLFSERDVACGLNTPYIIFQLSSNELPTNDAIIVVRDLQGREVDYLKVGDRISNSHPSRCVVDSNGTFGHDIDFSSPAQNKDIFRNPDGDGDWTDAGSGSNSGHTRCWNPGAVSPGVFDAVDFDFVPTFSPYDGVLTTKIASKAEDLKILSLNASQTSYVDRNVTIQVFLADEFGAEISNTYNYFTFNSEHNVTFSDFNETTANKVRKFGFRYCEDTVKEIFSYDPSNNILCDANHPDIGSAVDNLLQVDTIRSTDSFAVRPDNFSIDSTSLLTKFLNAGRDYNISIVAPDYSSVNTVGYNQIKSNLDINVTRKLPDGSDDNISNPLLQGDLTFASHSFVFADGVTTPSFAGINYTDVGDIDINVTDKNWASIDINDATDPTPPDCSDEGAYVCGEKSSTFIPNHFTFDSLDISNNDGNTTNSFTYYARFPDDINMTGRIAISVIARNALDNKTHNFTSGLYENNVTITPTITDNIHGEANATKISNAIIGFNDANKTIVWDDSNSSTYLRFNFHRVSNETKEPTDINISELNITIVSTYGMGTVDEANATDDGNLSSADGNSTFYYGRVHAPDYRGVSPIVATVYYEVYCRDCNKTALNITGAESIDSINWYANPLHVNNSFGVVNDYNATDGTTTDNQTPINNGTETIRLSLTAPLTAPHKDKIKMTPSNWLIYNIIDPTYPTNDFLVEFYKAGSDWAGEGIRGTVVDDKNVSIRQNRRLEW